MRRNPCAGTAATHQHIGKEAGDEEREGPYYEQEFM
jgi:hypothetical protein